MDAVQRRAALSDYLSQAAGPVSASVLAARFSVSRQIIVGDIALLRAGGLDIAATPRAICSPPHPRSDPPAGLCPPAGRTWAGSWSSWWITAAPCWT